MPSSSPELPPPGALPATLVRPQQLDLHFEGFSENAFATLESLREHPHVEQYRKVKAEIDRHVTGSFKRYRDDLALNWVIPNALPFETEKNVFSRILKNDFGAGGSHHHLWMSFYRVGSKRLLDPQLSHSISPDGFRVGLYVGDYGQTWVQALRDSALAEPERFRALMDEILADEAWQAFAYVGSKGEKRPITADALADLSAWMPRLKGFWVRRIFDRADVRAWGPDLVRHSLDALDRVWPLYRSLFDARSA